MLPCAESNFYYICNNTMHIERTIVQERYILFYIWLRSITYALDDYIMIFVRYVLSSPPIPCYWESLKLLSIYYKSNTI
jgi:hypothetical protein